MKSNTRPTVSSAELLIRQEIERIGPMNFSAFVDLALYHPRYGYYNQAASRRGMAGDYFTSLQVSRLFPQILAGVIAQMREALGTTQFSLIEVGSGGGEFLEEALKWLSKEEDGLAGLRVWAVERSRPARDQLIKRLSRFPRCRVVSSIQDIEWMGTLEGCIFSNELFDALPFHRMRYRQGEWREILVEEKDGELVEVGESNTNEVTGQVPSKEPSFRHAFSRNRGFDRSDSVDINDPGLRHAGMTAREPEQLPNEVRKNDDPLPSLIDGHELEFRPQIPLIYEEWGNTLARGYVLTVDYGHPRETFLNPSRSDGTWMCYRKHKATRMPFDHIGDQDITAHVDFTQLVESGRAAGFEPLLFCSQGIFLSHAGQKQIEAYLSCAPEAEKGKRAAAIQQLVHPDSMGTMFWTLVQTKNAPLPSVLTGIPNRLRRLV